MDQGCSFQLTTEEAWSAPDIMTNMFLCMIMLIIFYDMLMFMLLIGTFSMNSLLALVLFDLGASRSFVSQSFSREFDKPIGE